MAFEVITTDLKLGQRVQVAAPRGTRQEAEVKGLVADGRILVRYPAGEFDLVDKEDIEV